MYRLCALFAVALVTPLDASAQQQFPATLAGHAVLPALAIALDPPKDADPKKATCRNRGL
jgi:hypothetical protein